MRTQPVMLLLLASACVPSAFAQQSDPCAGMQRYEMPDMADGPDGRCRLSFSEFACERVSTDPADTVFLATVTRVLSIDSPFLDSDGHCGQQLMQQVTVSVKEQFRGTVPTTFEFKAGGVNGEYFKTGHTYLIYALKATDGSLSFSRCNGTKDIKKSYPTDHAAQDELQYLRSLPTLPATTTLFVSTWIVAMPDHPGKPPGFSLGGEKIDISGPQSLNLTTDSGGRAYARDIPSGHYTVHITQTVQGKVWPDTDQQFDLTPKSCRTATFYIESPQYDDLVKQSVQRARASKTKKNP